MSNLVGTGVLIAFLVLTGAIPVFGMQPAPRPKPLSLEVERTGADLWVTWDSACAAIASAKSGKLTIDDGGTVKSLELDVDQLRSAAVLYSPTTGDVSFQLTVFDPDPVSESVRIKAGEAAPTPNARISSYVPPTPVRKATVTMTVGLRNLLSRMSVPVVQIDVQVKLDEAGNVTSAKALSMGDPRYRALADAAVDAARRWRYTPGQLSGKPIAGTAVISFRFARPGR